MSAHKERAEEYSLIGDDSGKPTAAQAEGLIHAVLYLAEQQAKTAEQARIANILTFHSITAQIDLSGSGDFDIVKALGL